MSSLTVNMVSRYVRRLQGFPGVSLRTLQWVTFILPAVFVIAIDYLRHFVFPFILHDWPGFLSLWGGGLLSALLFSKIVFRTIEGVQKEILQRNRELSLLYKAAYNQAEQLKALREAGMALTAELSVETVLQRVVDLSRELVGARYGALAVFDEEETGIERLITSGITPEERTRIDSFPAGLGIMAAVPGNDKPIRIADIRKHPLSVGFPPNHPPMKTLLGVPIVAKGRTIGNLKLTNKRGGQEFTQEDEEKVVMLAAQAAIAIQNARLYEQEQALAVLEERERIALDLHDGIIQDIYGIGLNLEQCIERAQAGDRDLPEHLTRAVENLNDIINDVRNYIFALQPTDPEGNDLIAGLDRMVREFRINSLVEAELSVSGDGNRPLANDHTNHLLQIVHEALTNVLKHARATSVTIEVNRLDDCLELSVVDNGIGFDPSKRSYAGLGLRNIAERAKILGSQLTIDSRPNQGARLTVRIP